MARKKVLSLTERLFTEVQAHAEEAASRRQAAEDFRVAADLANAESATALAHKALVIFENAGVDI